MSAEITNDPSMAFDGSCVFQVGTKRFKMPSFLLDNIGGAFRDMAELSNGSSDPVVLQDSEEGFKAFFDALTKPWESCLCSPNHDLEKVLNVLSLAHKYCIAPLEAQARTVAITLIRSGGTLMGLSPTMRLERVLQIGSETNTEAIIESAVGALLQVALIGETTPMIEDPPYHLLLLPELADRFCVPWPHHAVKIYYLAMCRGPEYWSRDPRLSLAQKAKLAIGAVNCVYALKKIAEDMRFPEMHYCEHGSECRGLGENFVSLLTETDKSPCDILGLLDYALSPHRYLSRPPCTATFLGIVKARMENERAQLAQYFQLVPEVVQSES